MNTDQIVDLNDVKYLDTINYLQEVREQISRIKETLTKEEEKLKEENDMLGEEFDFLEGTLSGAQSFLNTLEESGCVQSYVEREAKLYKHIRLIELKLNEKNVCANLQRSITTTINNFAQVLKSSIKSFRELKDLETASASQHGYLADTMDKQNRQFIRQISSLGDIHSTRASIERSFRHAYMIMTKRLEDMDKSIDAQEHSLMQRLGLDGFELNRTGGDRLMSRWGQVGAPITKQRQASMRKLMEKIFDDIMQGAESCDNNESSQTRHTLQNIRRVLLRTEGIDKMVPGWKTSANPEGKAISVLLARIHEEARLLGQDQSKAVTSFFQQYDKYNQENLSRLLANMEQKDRERESSMVALHTHMVSRCDREGGDCEEETLVSYETKNFLRRKEYVLEVNSNKAKENWEKIGSIAAMPSVERVGKVVDLKEQHNEKSNNHTGHLEFRLDPKFENRSVFVKVEVFNGNPDSEISTPMKVKDIEDDDLRFATTGTDMVTFKKSAEQEENKKRVVTVFFMPCDRKNKYVMFNGDQLDKKWIRFSVYFSVNIHGLPSMTILGPQINTKRCTETLHALLCATVGKGNMWMFNHFKKYTSLNQYSEKECPDEVRKELEKLILNYLDNPGKIGYAQHLVLQNFYKVKQAFTDNPEDDSARRSMINWLQNRGDLILHTMITIARIVTENQYYDINTKEVLTAIVTGKCPTCVDDEESYGGISGGGGGYHEDEDEDEDDPLPCESDSGIPIRYARMTLALKKEIDEVIYKKICAKPGEWGSKNPTLPDVCAEPFSMYLVPYICNLVLKSRGCAGYDHKVHKCTTNDRVCYLENIFRLIHRQCGAKHSQNKQSVSAYQVFRTVFDRIYAKNGHLRHPPLRYISKPKALADIKFLIGCSLKCRNSKDEFKREESYVVKQKKKYAKDRTWLVDLAEAYCRKDVCSKAKENCGSNSWVDKDNNYFKKHKALFEASGKEFKKHSARINIFINYYLSIFGVWPTCVPTKLHQMSFSALCKHYGRFGKNFTDQSEYQMGCTYSRRSIIWKKIKQIAKKEKNSKNSEANILLTNKEFKLGAACRVSQKHCDLAKHIACLFVSKEENLVKKEIIEDFKKWLIQYYKVSSSLICRIEWEIICLLKLIKSKKKKYKSLNEEIRNHRKNKTFNKEKIEKLVQDLEKSDISESEAE